MSRRILAALMLTGLCAGGVAIAQPPAGPTTPVSEADEARREILRPLNENAKLFRDFSASLLRLAQRLEKSEKVADRERAKLLRDAIEVVDKEGVENQFSTLIATLTKSKTVTISELNRATAQNKELTTAIREILAILLTDNDSAMLKAEIERTEKLLKELKRLIREQKIHRTITESGRGNKDKLERDQRNLAKKTEEVSKRFGNKPAEGDPKDAKPGKGKPSDSKPSDSTKKAKPKDGEPSDSKGKGKPSDSKPSESKSKGKGQGSSGDPRPKLPGESKPGEKKPDGPKPPPQPQQPQMPGREKVAEAIPHQNKAADEIKKDDRDKAVPEEDKAIDDLEQAQKELEERLKQLREEELERLLANLEARVNAMLQMQIEVYEATKQIAKDVEENGGEATRLEAQKAQEQADKEGRIVEEANGAIKLLESEGSAVAFPQILDEVRLDMVDVQRRLEGTVVNEDTQFIEAQIIDALKEMLEALKKARKEGGGGGGGGGGGEPPDPKLIDLIAELKMLKSLQVRVNNRTEKYAEKYEGEQTADPIIKNELQGLADRQIRIKEMTEDIAYGRNQ